MFTRKKQLRLRRLLILSTAAVIANLMVPATAQAQVVSPSDTTEVSHAVIVPPDPSPKPTVPLTNLPEAADKPVTVAKHLVVQASAYSSTVDQCDGDPFTTASGERVHDGTIAMNGIAFGTKIRIPDHYGDKIFTVTDRMNAKWGDQRIDIWMTTRDAAMQWGVRTVTIEILS